MVLSCKTYKNFRELNENERKGRDFVIRKVLRNSPILIMAPHGGRIEPGTSEIAKILADRKYSFYSFEGVKSVNNWLLHIPSANYNEAHALLMIKNSDVVITIHGCRGDKKKTLIGGRNKKLRLMILSKLKTSGFKVLESISKKFSGYKDNNICNQGKLGQGVQIEISRGLRDYMIKENKTMVCFAEAIQTAIEKYVSIQR